MDQTVEPYKKYLDAVYGEGGYSYRGNAAGTWGSGGGSIFGAVDNFRMISNLIGHDIQIDYSGDQES